MLCPDFNTVLYTDQRGDLIVTDLPETPVVPKSGRLSSTRTFSWGLFLWPEAVGSALLRDAFIAMSNKPWAAVRASLSCSSSIRCFCQVLLSHVYIGLRQWPFGSCRERPARALNSTFTKDLGDRCEAMRSLINHSKMYKRKAEGNWTGLPRSLRVIKNPDPHMTWAYRVSRNLNLLDWFIQVLCHCLDSCASLEDQQARAWRTMRSSRSPEIPCFSKLV